MCVAVCYVVLCGNAYKKNIYQSENPWHGVTKEKTRAPLLRLGARSVIKFQGACRWLSFWIALHGAHSCVPIALQRVEF